MTASAGKRILKGIGWVLGTCVALVVVAYLALLAINWRDRPPSETALRFEALYRDRPPIPDAENAYLYMMGFAVERDVDQASRVRGLRVMPDACRFASAECALELEKNETPMREWLASEQSLLDRYLELLGHSAWLEAVPVDVAAPLPSFSRMMDGQKLLLSKAYLLTEQKDAAGIRELLTSDIHFWRHVLSSSDLLISKMISVAALNRHFGVGNLILRRLPAELQTVAMPEEWRTPMTADERSLLRSFVGEWIYGKNLIRQSAQPGKWTDRITITLFQEQDTSNRRAEMLARAVDRMNVPFEQLPVALEDLQREFDDPVDAEGIENWFYNPAGKAVLLIGSSGFGPCGARVADLEGTRRVAVLATELRGKQVSADQVPPALRASDLRSPYDGMPFAWDDKEQSMVFIGLQRGERARQAFKY